MSYVSFCSYKYLLKFVINLLKSRQVCQLAALFFYFIIAFKSAKRPFSSVWALFCLATWAIPLISERL